MIGYSNFTGQVFGARHLIGKHGCEKVVRPHPLDGRRNLAATAKPWDREGARCIPPPARLEHGSIQQSVRQNVLDGLRLEELKYQFEWKRVLLGKRDVDAVIRRRGLQLEIERTAEALAQRESPGPVDARTERSVDDELHSASFVEKPLRDHRVLRW